MVFDLMLKLYFNVLLNKNELNMCMNFYFFFLSAGALEMGPSTSGLANYL